METNSFGPDITATNLKQPRPDNQIRQTKTQPATTSRTKQRPQRPNTYQNHLFQISTSDPEGSQQEPDEQRVQVNPTAVQAPPSNISTIYLLFTIYAKSRTRNQTARWDVVSTSKEIDKPARSSLPTEKYHERSGHSSISMKLQKLQNQPLLPAASDWHQGQQTDDASTW
ncbi:hypothetical protein CLU79DRAFT_835384 [Phycomyces nitens]|nr:hypothetical protein CLU79DRAFT_841382 [Phycomyces nitens]KAI9022252.1 hypothetical protein CLU79DRAFT_835384 [Phycomyces nitens]